MLFKGCVTNTRRDSTITINAMVAAEMWTAACLACCAYYLLSRLLCILHCQCMVYFCSCACLLCAAWKFVVAAVLPNYGPIKCC
jgi:hypothetical protein